MSAASTPRRRGGGQLLSTRLSGDWSAATCAGAPAPAPTAFDACHARFADKPLRLMPVPRSSLRQTGADDH